MLQTEKTATQTAQQLPAFVAEMIDKAKLHPLTRRAGKTTAGFVLRSYDGKEIQFFVQAESPSEHEYQNLMRFVFVDYDRDPEGESRQQFDDETAAKNHLTFLLESAEPVKIDNVFTALNRAQRAIRVDEESYYYAQGAVPPISGRECWAMGEASNHHQGEPLYYWFTTIREQFWGINGTQEFAENEFDRIRYSPLAPISIDREPLIR